MTESLVLLIADLDGNGYCEASGDEARDGCDVKGKAKGSEDALSTMIRPWVERCAPGSSTELPCEECCANAVVDGGESPVGPSPDFGAGRKIAGMIRLQLEVYEVVYDQTVGREGESRVSI